MYLTWDFMEECKDEGLSPHQAMSRFERLKAEEHERFLEEYNSRPDVCAGWAQQDMIDMRRRER